MKTGALDRQSECVAVDVNRFFRTFFGGPRYGAWPELLASAGEVCGLQMSSSSEPWWPVSCSLSPNKTSVELVAELSLIFQFILDIVVYLAVTNIVLTFIGIASTFKGLYDNSSHMHLSYLHMQCVRDLLTNIFSIISRDEDDLIDSRCICNQ